MGYDNALHDESVSYYSSAFSLNEYQKLASVTANGIENPTDRKFNAFLGIVGETGELAQNAYKLTTKKSSFHRQYKEFMMSLVNFGDYAEDVKHSLFHKHPSNYRVRAAQLTKENRKEELGDILWYVTWLCTEFGFTLEEVARHNISKLQKRYPEGFDPERSINREEALK